MCNHRKIEIVPYDPQWSGVFDIERDVIKSALGDNCVSIHHIGSTSVPGLVAKPKIDIVAAAKDRYQAMSALSKVGYAYDGEWNIPLKCGFTKRVGTHVNLHLFFDKDHPEIELNLLFRDYLRSHPDAKDAYADLKKKILSDPENTKKRVHVGTLTFPVYTLQKRSFIDDILRKAGFSRLRVIKCLTDAEREFANRATNAKAIDFSDTNYEHFVLYKGVDICGYAMLQLFPCVELVFLETLNPEHKMFFSNLINEWINVNNARISEARVSCS